VVDSAVIAAVAAGAGNMAAAGLLQPSSVFVELGAGKGFLSAWLHQVCGAEDIILLDRLGNFAKKVCVGLKYCT
jgi:tRNA A58 N-methylase Trm61